eukprot:706438-Pleurochrysis_carterae.AAC.1
MVNKNWAAQNEQFESKDGTMMLPSGAPELSLFFRDTLARLQSPANRRILEMHIHACISASANQCMCAKALRPEHPVQALMSVAPAPSLAQTSRSSPIRPSRRRCARAQQSSATCHTFPPHASHRPPRMLPAYPPYYCWLPPSSIQRRAWAQID